MAVNDCVSTEKLKKAFQFFSNLEHSKEFEIKEADADMMFAASWAVSFLSTPSRRKEVTKELGYSDRYNPFTSASTVNEVARMCESYVIGERKFNEYQAEQARRLCGVLLEYVEKLEKKPPVLRKRAY
jgi:hypothetical protein